MKSVYSNASQDIYETLTGSVVVHDHHPDAAVVLARYNDHLVVIRQYREAVGEDTFELPGGAVEPGERPEEAARRELLEETGLLAEELTALATVHSCGHVTNQTAHLFFASQSVAHAPQHLDPDEDVTVLFYTVPEVLDRIATGVWKNSELAHAVLIALLNGHVRCSEVARRLE